MHSQWENIEHFKISTFTAIKPTIPYLFIKTGISLNAYSKHTLYPRKPIHYSIAEGHIEETETTACHSAH
jgi:hypothetical protein